MQAVTDKMLLKFPDFMAPPSAKKSEPRPRGLHPSASFSKLDEPERLTRAQRASTIHNGTPPAGGNRNTTARANTVSESPPDRFEKIHDDDDHDAAESPEKLPPKSEELPIELASLTDR
jgi:hypothetical protein